jgi:AcrR family transcriptional regulator
MSTKRAETAQRILDGAAAAFAKGGYAATSMEEIAAAAGVSKLLLYRDYAGKRELYQAVLDRARELFTSAVPPAATNEALNAFFAMARRDPDGFTLLFRHAIREPEFAAYAQQVSDEWERRTEELIRPYEPDPVLRRWAAHVAIHNTHQMIIAWLEYGDPTRDADVIERMRASSRAAVVGNRPTREVREAAEGQS